MIASALDTPEMPIQAFIDREFTVLCMYAIFQNVLNFTFQQDINLLELFNTTKHLLQQSRPCYLTDLAK